MAQREIGLVAGRGNLPFEALKTIKTRGDLAIVVGLEGEVSPELSREADRFYMVSLCHIGKIIEVLNQRHPLEVVFAGKVTKEAVFNGNFDNVTLQLLQSLPQKNDDAILGAIVNEFEKNGLHVAKQTEYLRHLLVPAGAVYGEVSASEMADIRLGFQMAKAIGGLDIGQSVIVKNGIVLAVEAIEGTDRAILRSGQLGGAGAVVVKVSKPNQDERFDVPTVGTTTLQSMISSGAAVLAIEAGKTLMTERESFLEIAAKNKIRIIAVGEDDFS